MDIPKLRIGNGAVIMDGFPLTPPFFSLWDKWKHLRGRSIVIGFIGPRGSGKTTSAIRALILDYFMKGRRVWSDSLPVAVDLVTKAGVTPLRSIPIEEGFKFGDCYNGCVFLDEINEGDGEAYRSMSGRALELSYDLQELRKGNDGGLSKMDVIWTTQSEMFNMPRIRFQTDIIIKCADLSLSKKKVGIGEYSRWEIWDYSGILSGKNVSAKMPEAPVVFTKPWWHTFKTGTKKREERRAIEEAGQEELYKVSAQIASIVEASDRGILRQEIWVESGVSDIRQQKAISRILAENFAITMDLSGRKFKVNPRLLELREKQLEEA